MRGQHVRWVALMVLVGVYAVAGGFTPAEPPPARARTAAQGLDGMMFAFRGNAAEAPENTLPALESAASAGTTTAWVDVRTTADGELVLLRDETLDRTTDCTGPLRAMTAAEVAACDAGSWFDSAFAGVGVPGVAEALVVPGLALVLDLADADPATAVAAVQGAGLLDTTGFAVTQPSEAAALRGAGAEHVWLRAGSADSVVRQQALGAGATGVAVPASALNGADVGAARRAGLLVASLNPEGEAALHDALATGVDHVVTPRLAAFTWSLGLTFRTYDRESFSLASAAGTNFPAALEVGDFNGDGRADLALGAPSDNAGGRDAGWAGVSYGGDEFPGAMFSSTGDEPAGQWGSLFAVADLNSDGYDDLAIGVPRRDFADQDSGTVWLLDGTAAGLGQLSRPIRNIGQGGAHDGASLAVGDFNSDLAPDLAVGAPMLSRLGQQAAGQVTLMRSRPGAGPVSDGSLVLDRTVEIIPGLPAAGEQLGAALAAGDFDGDGYTDLAVSVPGGDAGDIRDAGSVIVVYGAVDAETEGIITERVVELTRDMPAIPGEAERNGEFGAALAAGDFDGDSFDDLVIGAPGATVGGRRGAGDVIVMYGSAAGLMADAGSRVDSFSAEADNVPGVPQAGDGFGRVLAVGNVTGSELPDLVIGIPEKGIGLAAAAGQVVVVPAGRSGLDPRLASEIRAGMIPLGRPAENRQRLGRSLAIADLNGDGAIDLAIGAVGQSISGVAEAGALIVAWGFSTDLPGVPTATPRPPTATATSTRTPLPRPSATARPLHHVYLPYSARLALLGRYPPLPVEADPGGQ